MPAYSKNIQAEQKGGEYHGDEDRLPAGGHITLCLAGI